MDRNYSVEELEKRIGYSFQNPDLLKRALTHSSFTNEQKINRIGDYERLEFLGDSILEMVSSLFLYHTHPQMPEGELSKLRASMVCEPSLAFCARDLELGEFIYLGKGEELTGGRHRESITSDVMEAIIGAIYLDGGFDPAKGFIDRFILSDLEGKRLFFDAKTNLQEVVQRDIKKELFYESLGEEGPEHDKVFRTQVRIDGEVFGVGKGRTKKAAEQQAAYQALLRLKENG